MLPRQHKLSRASFPSYKDSKFTWTGSVLRIQAYLPILPVVMPVVVGVLHEQNKKETRALFAVVVAKRFGKSAVLRHAFKRQVLGAIAATLPQFTHLPYGRYVVLPKGALSAISPLSVTQDIHDFLSQYKRQ